ncbi:MAG: hypothetical protein WBQ08_07450 [Candidatus Sulfotelmatobacter sp.]
MVRKLAEATKACRMRRTRGETGPRRRLAVAARRCAVVEWVWPPTAFFGEAGLPAALAGFA